MLPSPGSRTNNRLAAKLYFLFLLLSAGMLLGAARSSAQTCPTWSNVGSADFSASNAEFLTIAISSTGTPYIAFRDNASSGRATVMRYNGSSWGIVGSAGFSAGVVQFTQIAIDGSGTPYVGYVDGANGSKPTVMKFNGTSWVTVGTPAFSVAHTNYMSLAIGSGGAPYAVYNDNGLGSKAVVKRFDGTNWVAVGPATGFSAGSVNTTDIAIDGSGTPYVSFEDGNASQRATVMKFDGTNWVNVGAAAFSAGQAQAIDIELNPSGAPYVIFSDATVSNKTTVMRFDGTSWGIVGSAGISAGTTPYIDMAIDGSGTPYAAFTDGGVGVHPRVRKFDGSAWVDVAGGSVFGSIGLYTGIAINSSGVPYVVYNNYIAGALANVSALGSVSTAITGVDIMCETGSVSYIDATAGGTWSSSNTAVATIGSSSGAINGVSGGAVTITYTLGTCTATKVLTVLPLVSSNSITGSGAVTAGSTTTLSHIVSGGVWTSSNTATATVGSSTGIVTGIATGMTTISYAATNSCGSAVVSTMVTVSPAPVSATQSQTNVSCRGGANGTATVVASGGTPGYTYSWAPSGGTAATATGLAAGSYTCTITDAASASIPITFTITQPAASLSAAVTAIVNVTCFGGSNGSTTVTPGGGTGPYSYSWAPSGGTAATASSLAVGVYTCTITDANGCTYTRAVSIASWPAIVTSVSAQTNATCAASNDGSATISASGGAGGFTYSWAPGGSTSATATGLAGGIYTVTITDANSCPKTQLVTITEPAITGAATVCAGASATLTGNVAGGTWSSSDLSVATIGSLDGVVNGVTTGVAAITYELSTCTVIRNITVNGLPSAGVVTGASVVVVGSAITLSDVVSGGVWSSSNTAAATVGSSDGVVSAVGAGVITISYAVTGICGTTVATKVVTVNATSITGAATVCVGVSSTYSAGLSGGVWSAPASSVISGPSVTGIVTGLTPGTASITYTLPPSDKIVFTMTVNAAPPAITGSAIVCPGATTTLANTTPGGTWTSGNTAVSTVDGGTGIVTGVAAGTVGISYATAAGCPRVAIVTVNAAPAAIAGTGAVCVGATTTFSSATTPGLAWTSSNTSVATVNSSLGAATGVAPGTATITYMLGSGCDVTTVLTVTVAPSPITGPAGGCMGTTATLLNAVSGGVWTSSNTAAATINSSTGVVTGVAYGNTYITYSLGAGCSKTRLFTVNTPPPAIVGHKTACVGSATTLTSGSSGSWSTSSPAIATINVAGVVNGVSAGTADITYTGSGSGCATATVVTVTAAPAAISGANNLCAGTTTTLTNSSTGGSWISGNGGMASVGASSGVVTALGTMGTVTITYAFSPTCKVTKSLTVNPLPAPIGGTTAMCRNLTATLSNVTSGGIWSSSNPTVATIAVGVAPGYGAWTSTATAGNSTISYTLATGCARTVIVTVNPCGRPGGNLQSAASGLQLYPNPTTGTFTIVTAAAGTLQVYSMDGKEVSINELTAGQNEITLPAGIARGMYLCRYNSADGSSQLVRLVVE